jgi:hypothetical protein
MGARRMGRPSNRGGGLGDDGDPIGQAARKTGGKKGAEGGGPLTKKN